jgi:hypothetical protein
MVVSGFQKLVNCMIYSWEIHIMEAKCVNLIINIQYHEIFHLIKQVVEKN